MRTVLQRGARGNQNEYSLCLSLDFLTFSLCICFFGLSCSHLLSPSLPSDKGAAEWFLPCIHGTDLDARPSLSSSVHVSHSYRLRIVGTQARVSALLTVVGQFHRPTCAGKGGLRRGLPERVYGRREMQGGKDNEE